MSLRVYKGITPSQRFKVAITFDEITKTRPEKTLLVNLRGNSGRTGGKITVRGKGGGHKRNFRYIDFKRNKRDIEGTIAAIEYDPNRSANIALVHYKDGEKRYILAPNILKVGDKITSAEKTPIRAGNAMPLQNMPVGTFVHNIEIMPGAGGQIVRSAGAAAIVAAKEGNYVHLKLPSKEIRKVNAKCYATIGQVGNIDWKNISLGKAGKSRHMGRRPKVRGVAMDPASHPHGGGEGKSGTGMNPKTPTGKSAFGKTRNRKKPSSKFILSRRK
ncbi:MAG: 50S ribosomal protein L2 [Candidatus Curtissbacteria bacterium GW2011_GWA1_40_9]|uniref:Large ribosomal subunit protein uL2 n=1 Tax=Candidatus Curtissbacteria bacterium GW2011_GWA1_40_9 TaxID=1618408 RepID=A0A0G0TM08_9BACT|nr:MAG: 50S ribosomal protein L2 [Candidatus Curtissbacteria bacterium GW2011_GWA1_40_9]